MTLKVGNYGPTARRHALTDEAVRTADRIGRVTVDMGDTACKVPSAAEYIEKVRQRGALGKKRKTVKC